ncbi:MAG: phosphatase PAP2 family protein [Chitinophagaceae bacterium]|nr:phosphatase PAP2 family protein [Chitinophagaceae bacterium]
MKRIDKSIRKKLAGIALLSVELLIVLAIFLFALIVFTLLAYGVLKMGNDQFDFYVFDKVGNLVTPFTTRFMQFITFFGNHKFLIPANLVLIVYFLFIKKRRWYSIKIPVIATGGVLLMFILKFIFNRPRPLIPLLEPVKGLSFPSGHAMMSMSFYGLLIFLVWENINNKFWKWTFTWLLFAFILLIGFTRIYLRLHYFSDVIAGFSVGIIWLSISIYAMRRIERYSRRKIEPVINELDKADGVVAESSSAQAIGNKQ